MFIGLCPEFSLLSHLDDTPEKALAGIRDVVGFAVESLAADVHPAKDTT